MSFVRTERNGPSERDEDWIGLKGTPGKDDFVVGLTSGRENLLEYPYAAWTDINLFSRGP
ncbi:hypothetical protein CVCC1112_3511 [Paenarthrobacter nicotinovorans]|nr:hypothetical protein CVCC1112_3511 [Paenarthrobacter nicotinovorans]